MAYGEAARQVFGAAVVTKYASAAASDAQHYVTSNDFLAAAFSAAHFVRLTGSKDWSDEDQERMSTQLIEEVRLGLQSGHDAGAASRAASLQMLTGDSPWTEEEMERLRKALSDIPAQSHVYASVSVADQMADYLLLGGPLFWSADEFHEMRTAVIVDFEHCVSRGADVLAADRLAIFDVLEAALETLITTTA